MSTELSAFVPNTPAEETRDHSDGDVFCEEDGAYIGQYEEIDKQSLPVEISMYYKGFFYVYKLDRKEQQG